MKSLREWRCNCRDSTAYTWNILSAHPTQYSPHIAESAASALQFVVDHKRWRDIESLITSYNETNDCPCWTEYWPQLDRGENTPITYLLWAHDFLVLDRWVRNVFLFSMAHQLFLCSLWFKFRRRLLREIVKSWESESLHLYSSSLFLWPEVEIRVK